jgi:hypothetical protein
MQGAVGKFDKKKTRLEKFADTSKATKKVIVSLKVSNGCKMQHVWASPSTSISPYYHYLEF